MKKYIVPLLLALSIAACTTTKQEETPGQAPAAIKDSTPAEYVALTDAQIKNAGIVTGKATHKELHSLLKVNGVVEAPPEKVYTISFPMGGYLKSNRLIPGMQIHKGQSMATIEDAQFIQLQQDYLMGKSKLRYTEEDFKRQEELNKTKANSDKVFQQAKTEYESQKILVRALREKLLLIGIQPDALNENNITRTISINAPISGFVSKVNANPGKYVAPTDILFELVDPSGLHLHLQVFEQDAQGLQKGQKVTCYSHSRPQQKMEATIQFMDPGINEGRTMEVHAHFDRTYPGLLPGMFLNAEIEREPQQSLSVPEDAIVRWQNKFYVFLVEDTHRFILKQVETGISTQGYIQIKTDLAQQDIVLHNAYALLMMMKNSAEEE